jgi:hypothetical protein
MRLENCLKFDVNKEHKWKDINVDMWEKKEIITKKYSLMGMYEYHTDFT